MSRNSRPRRFSGKKSVAIGALVLWCGLVAVRAAIYESVELVKRARKKSAATFVNAVLRKFAANPPSLGDWEGQIQKAQSVPELAGSSAHPQWMVERWSQEFSFAAALGLCGFDQQVPPTFIRLRDHAAEADLCSEGISLTPGGFLSSARRVCFGDVTRTKVFADHRIVIQDEASQLIAALVGRGHSILDGCAAPGGKTWAIADRNPRSRIVAVELHAHRAEVLRKRIEAPNVEVWTGRLQDYPVTKLFDRVLVDVPCSGTGTLARHPEIKWRLQMTEIDDLRSRQLEILNTAMQHVAPKGRLVYSTCSLEPEEDESVVSEAVVSNPAFQFLDCRLELERLQRDGEWLAPGMDSFLRREFLRTLPGIHQCDGFFAAILERA